jgi:hypothetical protein
MRGGPRYTVSYPLQRTLKYDRAKYVVGRKVGASENPRQCYPDLDLIVFRHHTGQGVREFVFRRSVLGIASKRALAPNATGEECSQTPEASACPSSNPSSTESVAGTLIPTHKRPSLSQDEQCPTKRMRGRGSGSSNQEGEGETRRRSSASESSSLDQDEMDVEVEQGIKPSPSAPTAPSPKKKRTRTLITPHQSAVLHALLAQVGGSSRPPANAPNISPVVTLPYHSYARRSWPVHRAERS